MSHIDKKETKKHKSVYKKKERKKRPEVWHIMHIIFKEVQIKNQTNHINSNRRVQLPQMKEKVYNFSDIL